MKIKKFGVRLRELRKQASLTQRKLANKVNVNFSYLSKIENGVVAAPSKSVILRLAEVLNADKDELLILAGRVPSDVAKILSKDREMLQLIRSPRVHKIIKASNKVRTSWYNLTRSLQNSMEGAGSFFKNHRGLSRVAISVAMVVAIVAGLWSASPAQALNITVTNPSSGTLGSTYTFHVEVVVENTDLLPIDHIDFSIYHTTNSSYRVDCANLPLIAVSNYSMAGGTVSVTAVPGANWGQASGSRYGYGYGYQSGTWYTPSLGSGTTSGYGYGYSPYVGPTSITYTITWTIPSSWQPGPYEILFLVYGDNSVAFTTPTRPSFTLYAYTPPPPLEPGVTSIPVYWDGRVLSDVAAESVDGKATLDISKDTIAKTAEDKPLREISIIPMEDPPAPPVDASIVGLTYNLGPDGATFDPPITLTFTYDPDEIPEDFNEEDLVIAIWDGEKWVELEGCVVDTATHTITAPVSHFTPFTIITPAPPAPPAPPVVPAPAAFSVSDLSVLPAEVEPAEAITIAVSVANTGDESGSYEVTLKIDDVVVATKEVTLAGGASQRVTFTTTKDIAGTYSVDVSGLAGSFTVKEEVVPPVPAAFTISSLTILPTEVDVGKSVAISVLASNTGDLTGSYEVTLKIDNVVVDTKEVTLAGGASQKVSFTTTKDVAGTYTVNVNGQSSTFTVKEEVVPPIVPPVAPKPIAWWVWLLVGLGSVVVVGLLVYFLWWRQRFA